MPTFFPRLLHKFGRLKPRYTLRETSHGFFFSEHRQYKLSVLLWGICFATFGFLVIAGNHRTLSNVWDGITLEAFVLFFFSFFCIALGMFVTYLGVIESLITRKIELNIQSSASSKEGPFRQSTRLIRTLSIKQKLLRDQEVFTLDGDQVNRLYYETVKVTSVSDCTVGESRTYYVLNANLKDQTKVGLFQFTKLSHAKVLGNVLGTYFQSFDTSPWKEIERIEYKS